MSSLKKISLKDIAEAAGVSTALVSFVLNGKKKEYRVGEETAQRILKIANEMNCLILRLKVFVVAKQKQ